MWKIWMKNFFHACDDNNNEEEYEGKITIEYFNNQENFLILTTWANKKSERERENDREEEKENISNFV